ncbi:MAG: hypothetical protein JXR75_06365 [Rhodobacteraceae bacterium]|nr:hypothetical protein [Paracoccaceae bacterium]
MGSAVLAQGWKVASFDNGAWFEAWVTATESWPEFHCGGVSPRGLPLPESDEAMLTQPGTLGLIMPDRSPGLAYSDPLPRSDLRLVTDRAAFGLPLAHYDLINSQGWTHPIGTKDAAIAALSVAQVWAIDGAHGRWGPFPTTGLGPALAEMIAYCEARWAAPPRPKAPAPAAPTNVTAMMQAALTRDIAETCEWRGYSVDPGAPLAADLDADGQPDLVMDFRAVTCMGATHQGHCGAALCYIHVYLSSRYPATGTSDDFLGIGAKLVQGTDGKVWIGTGTRAAACPDAYDPATCTSYWRAGRNGLEVVPCPAP